MKVVLRSVITNLYCSLLFIILHTTMFAQAPEIQWTNTFGGVYSDYGNAVQQSSDGGYIITGDLVKLNDPSPIGDVWLIKTADNGDTLWTKKFI